MNAVLAMQIALGCFIFGTLCLLAFLALLFADIYNVHYRPRRR